MPNSKQKRIKLSYSASYNRDFFRLEKPVAEIVRRKLALFQNNPRHPSLRVKKMQRHKQIWELSVAEHYRVTFEWSETQGKKRIAILRRVGTHDILKTP